MALPAYDQCIKASHVFNLLDARGVISVTERQSYILRVRELAKACGEAWLATEAGGGAGRLMSANLQIGGREPVLVDWWRARPIGGAVRALARASRFATARTRAPASSRWNGRSSASAARSVHCKRTKRPPICDDSQRT